MLMFSGTPQNKSGAPENEAPIIVGVDEAGRGPLAGPVVASAVLLCKGSPAGLADSKQLSAKRRNTLDLQLRETCYWAVGIAEPAEIDQLNILQATMHAMAQAVAGLAGAMGRDPDEVLIDGNMTPAGRAPQWRWQGRAIVGGDAIEPAISAASIIAKQWRDRLMVDAARDHPFYGWERNKGYGTKEHMEALRKHGATPLHRQSFAPVAQLALL